MKINNVFLDKIGTKFEQYPDTGLPEIAFVGKSNVGKSSLINSLVNRKAIARTSSTPGKTRTINFYNIEEKLYFVDLPGYGYAKLSRSESEKWGKMIENYLSKREELRAIVLLVDIRHEVGRNDLQMYEWLKYYGCKTIVVCTKSDKVAKNKLQSHLKVIRKGLSLADGDLIMPFSSLNKAGKDELLKVILNEVFSEENNDINNNVEMTEVSVENNENNN